MCSSDLTGVNSISANLISTTGNITGGNLLTGGNVSATGNVIGGNLVTTGALSVSGNANIGNIGTGILTATGNIIGGNLVTTGVVTTSGNVLAGNVISSGYSNVATNLNIGNSTVNTTITWDSTTTSSVSANQTIASFNATGITGVEYIVKGIDSVGGKYSISTVQAVTDGTSVDYSSFGSVQLGGTTGVLAVNLVGGYLRLQVTPASSNSTVWTTQYRLI